MRQNRLKLDDEELLILRDFERGEFESIQKFKAEKTPTGGSSKNNPAEGKAHQHSYLFS